MVRVPPGGATSGNSSTGSFPHFLVLLSVFLKIIAKKVGRVLFLKMFFFSSVFKNLASHGLKNTRT